MELFLTILTIGFLAASIWAAIRAIRWLPPAPTIAPRTLQPTKKLREAELGGRFVSCYPTEEQVAKWDELGDVVKQRDSERMRAAEEDGAA